MPLTLLFPPGPLYAPYHALEDALDFARAMHEHQLRLRAGAPAYYDKDVHAIVLAFSLRAVGRKLDALIAAFRAQIRIDAAGGLSRRTLELQSAMQQYNAAVASRDVWDNSVDASANVLELAFDCLASLERDIQTYEERN
ncbi:MAG TPA: hypothetical protein VEC01_15630 [Noviherbaspirillum sp.]|uniref:hypothetical protein n=1 Tax=Noviherbaspirillum sp. TaxID=1926288 RepID=UPI002D529941|nr:hypothetical protein [Noviherbaspirillum sp.]HYD96759.1 hypothetical protein [Noviherbaspirillum sp.]